MKNKLIYSNVALTSLLLLRKINTNLMHQGKGKFGVCSSVTRGEILVAKLKKVSHFCNRISHNFYPCTVIKIVNHFFLVFFGSKLVNTLDFQVFSIIMNHKSCYSPQYQYLHLSENQNLHTGKALVNNWEGKWRGFQRQLNYCVKGVVLIQAALGQLRNVHVQ